MFFKNRRNLLYFFLLMFYIIFFNYIIHILFLHINLLNVYNIIKLLDFFSIVAHISSIITCNNICRRRTSHWVDLNVIKSLCTATTACFKSVLSCVFSLITLISQWN